LYGAKI